MCVSCSKCVLILFNILTAIIGAALLAIGLIIRLGQDHIEWVSEKIIPILQRVLLGASSSVSFAELLNSLTLGVIIIGAVLLGISMIGLLGACCESECMLIMYAVLMVAIILAEAASIGVFFVYKDKIVPLLGESLKGTLKGYTGKVDALDGGNQITAAWDAMQSELQCCGAQSYTDYDEVADFHRNCDRCKVPSSCCRPNQNCVYSPSSGTVYTQNCTDALVGFLQKHDLIVGLVVGAVFLFEIILLGMSCAIVQESRKK